MSLTASLRSARWAMQNWLMHHAGLRVERVQPRPHREDERTRHAYQRRFIPFDIAPGAAVLDIGSGGDPFPKATVLLDRFTGKTQHRHAELVRDGRRFVEADIIAMPFADREFEFVYCAHVLEHVDDPLAACREIMRVGRRGYIETPTLGKDMLFAWNVAHMHKWHVVAIADTLCFYELSARQNEGIRSREWQKLIFGPWRHPLQDAYFDNADLFNVMFPWKERFDVHVFMLDGRMRSLTTRADAQPVG
ncbi:MAG: class I SAM-dependent methyltransferase [Planctomycetes bacterium]|nr:class I SAM-dependent methyltransferase [Planctomycetota bacterium]